MEVSSDVKEPPALPAQLSSFPFSKKIEPDFLGLGYSAPAAPWLDIRVFYLRLSCCSLDNPPETLSIRLNPRLGSCYLEVNGSRIPPAEEVVLILRRDRMDTESAEATYVSTDRLRTTGSLTFDVREKDNFLICGAVEKSDVWPDSQGLDRLGAVGTLTKGSKTGWTLDCKCAIASTGCTFLKRRADSMNTSLSSPSMEVYVAGRYCGAPVILTQTVELLARRKITRRGTLDAIPEADEYDRLNSNVALADLASQMEERSFYEGVDDKPTGLQGLYGLGDYMEGDEGEITWFNAGVRVGVGLGLGMCVGLGIGVGLMMRAYQSTTRTFRRRFL